MTNFEYYKEQILETVNKHSTNFAVVDGKPISCAVTPCPDCQIKGGICAVERIKWLYEEHIEQPKLTKKERQFCELVETGWIARDNYDNRDCLKWYKDKPYKQNDVWVLNGTYFAIDLKETIHIKFSFIKWEDEPWSVEELLKLEVEE